MEIKRRSLLGGAAVAGGLLAAGPFGGFLARERGPRAAPPIRLGPVADLRDGVPRLWVPEGFGYRSFHDTEWPVVLDDGTRLPGSHDGMGAFQAPGGNTILVRNHEVKVTGSAFGPGGVTYDPVGGGGTTTIEVTRYGEVVRAHTSLSGTHTNCCGGRMPWGTWISCEETVHGPDVAGPGNAALREPHGFIFEVPARGTVEPRPITAAGRFAHESVAYDPRGGTLYLTEDNFAFPSCFYRYRPPRRPDPLGADGRGLADGGRLQALAVRGRPRLDLAAAQEPGAVFPVGWVDIDDPAPRFPYTRGLPAPTTEHRALRHVGDQGRAGGAALFSRLEGSTYRQGVVYFTSTQGGGAAEEHDGPFADGYGNGHGQIWAYHCAEEVLRLVYQAPQVDGLDFPDNITTSPSGTLIVCEDGENDNYVRGLTRHGQLLDIALNRLVNRAGVPRRRDEFAGCVFSPDGHTLFVNVLARHGMTIAIWGPWTRLGI
jgi:secreted PhoX family phosphatase